MSWLKLVDIDEMIFLARPGSHTTGIGSGEEEEERSRLVGQRKTTYSSWDHVCWGYQLLFVILLLWQH